MCLGWVGGRASGLLWGAVGLGQVELWPGRGGGAESSEAPRQSRNGVSKDLDAKVCVLENSK